MSFERAIVDHFYIVRWGVPTAADIDRILKEQAELAIKCGRKLVFLAITPPESSPPDEPTRQAFTRAMEPMLESCDHLHIAFEGSGFAVTIKRSALTGMLIIAGQRGRVSVGESVDQLIARTTEPTRSEFKRAVRLACAMGVPINSLEVGNVRNLKLPQSNERSASR